MQYLRCMMNKGLSCFLVSTILIVGAASAQPRTAQYFRQEIARFDSLNHMETYSKNAILFTGSSSIRLWTTIHEDMQPYEVIQRGFGGARIEDLDWYYDHIFVQKKYKAIVIFCGTNNITGANEDMSADSILYYTRKINSRIRKQYRNIPIYWIAITPVNSRIKVMDKVAEMNQKWKEDFSHQKNIRLIETTTAFLGPDGKPLAELFISDQLHLNREGYKRWSAIIHKVLDETLH